MFSAKLCNFTPHLADQVASFVQQLGLVERNFKAVLEESNLKEIRINLGNSLRTEKAENTNIR